MFELSFVNHVWIIVCFKVCFVEQDIPSQFCLKFDMDDFISSILFKAAVI